MNDMLPEVFVPNADPIVPMIRDYEARINVTFEGQNGDLPDPVAFDASDAEIRVWIREAISTGSIPGIVANAAPDIEGFKVDRFPANEARPFNLIQLRPKTAFGV